MKTTNKNIQLVALIISATVGFYIFQSYILLAKELDALGAGFFIWFICNPINLAVTQLAILLWLFKEQGSSNLRIVGTALTMGLGYIITFPIHLLTLSWLLHQPWFTVIPETLKILMSPIILILLNCPLDFAIARLFFKQNVTKEKGILICLATITALILPTMFLVIRSIF